MTVRSRGIALIVPAAGAGTRMKSCIRKPFLAIEEEPILNLTLERFAGVADLDQIIVVLNPSDYDKRDDFAESLRLRGVTDLVQGGSTRTQSVANALCALRTGISTVLIHDAVRPFVQRRVILGVIEAAQRAGAAIAAVPVKDTLKRVAGSLIAETAPREGLYIAQTPQGFSRELLERVYAGRSTDYTDDAALVEQAGESVEIVESSYLNFKITSPEDLELAEALMRAVRAGRVHF